MIDLVAKRYVKALMSDRNTKDLTSIYKELKEISTAYTDEKFIVIISLSNFDISFKDSYLSS